MLNPPKEIFPLNVPEMVDVCEVFKSALEKHFQKVTCEVADCPDLTNEPYKLSASGLGGKCVIADAGSFHYFAPLPNKEKIYDLHTILEGCSLSDGFAIGAAVGPFNEVGVSCELMVNFTSQNKENYITRLLDDSNSKNSNDPPPYELTAIKSSTFAMVGQFLVTAGQPGKVIHVHAEGRNEASKTVDEAEKTSFTTILQDALAHKYKEENSPVGVGGVFLVRDALVNIHIMPDFSEVPLNTFEEVNKWFKFYDVEGPFICLGEMVSHDPKNVGLRAQHFHGFDSKRSVGGHYHYDVAQEGRTVQYDGYFVLAESLLRLDRPSVAN